MQNFSILDGWVMKLKIYQNVPRLKSTEKTGNKHIFVKRSICSSYRQHWHDYFEIETVVSGSGMHNLNGTEYEICEGDAYLLTPVDIHKITSDSTLEILNVSFDTTWLSEEMQYFLYSPECAKRKKFDATELGNFISAVNLIKTEYERGGPSVRQLLEYLISRFMLIVIISYTIHQVQIFRHHSKISDIMKKLQLTALKTIL